MLDARTSASQWDAAVPTGVTGLDHILGGGLPAHRVHLLEGDPGTGKTTLALQFLLEGLRRGERCLYVCLSETQDELRSVAHSHGWSLDGVTVHELTPSEGILDPDEQYSLFHPSEVELADTINTILERVRELQPTRVVIDSLAEVRLLAREPVRYRRQILALKQFFVGRRATVLLIDDRAAERRDLHVQSISHGVIRLEHIAPDYGPERRRLQVLKLRGVKFRGGYHDFRIETGGIVVFPRIDASEHDGGPALTPVPSGIDALDQLLGGGLMTGTSAVIMGPAGVGKTTVATQFISSVVRAGGKGTIYLLDEHLATFDYRARALGFDIPEMVAAGQLFVESVQPGQFSAGEMANAIRTRVERDGVSVVMLDSLNGYLNAMQAESAVLVQLHELLSYLSRRGVLTLMIVAQNGVLGAGVTAPLDLSYLADTLILMRFFEAGGAVHKAVSVVKQRTGQHEHTIREFSIRNNRLTVGEPLTGFRGVLTGTPDYIDNVAPGRNRD
jgi:circadian clock protein KaiC